MRLISSYYNNMITHLTVRLVDFISANNQKIVYNLQQSCERIGRRSLRTENMCKMEKSMSIVVDTYHYGCHDVWGGVYYIVLSWSDEREHVCIEHCSE